MQRAHLLEIVVLLEGRTVTGMLQWHGKASVKRLVAVLEKHVGDEPHGDTRSG
jgi:hypothetical protein